MSKRTVSAFAAVILVTFLLLFGDSPLVSLWPPVAALLVILATRHALVGLLAGGLVGALLIAGGNPFAALVAVFADHLAPSLRSSWKLGAVAFTLILGGFASVLEAGGGFTQLMLRSMRQGRDRGRQLEMAAAGLGLLCFFDGLANSMVVGRVGRDLADRSGVARVKLAYIADSTSSAVACVAIISTWIAFQLSMISEAYALTGREANPYGVFLASLPYNFYCWFTLALMFVAIRFRFHPGPMGAMVAQTPPARSSGEDAQGARGRIGTALVPLGVLLGSFFALFLLLGSPRPLLPPSRDKIVAAFGSDAGPMVLILAALAATLAAVALFPADGAGRLRPALLAFVRGVRAMVVPIFILIAAWILGSVIDALGTADLIAGLATRSDSLIWLPTLVFLTGAAISFATGTSWGTMGLLFPLAIPAAVQMGATDSFLPVIVAAVFSGAVFGDHCSPFSDTTIVTSISCGVEPHDHVRTQIPYALITAGVAIACGFLPAGLGWAAPISLALGLGVILLLPRLFGRGAPAALIGRALLPAVAACAIFGVHGARAAGTAVPTAASTPYTAEAPMLRGYSEPGSDWEVQALFTVGETIGTYRPPGLLDGIGALHLDPCTVRAFVNHELRDDYGYPYSLANGTALTGARVSFFDIDRCAGEIGSAGLAYDTAVDRYGAIVTHAGQINEGQGNVNSDGFERFCSSALFPAGGRGFVDDVYMTGEETGGGQAVALDVLAGNIHIAPALGRASFENLTLVETGAPGSVGILIGDDRAGAPILLYLGTKDAVGDGSFLDRNGLASGGLHVWVADNGDLSSTEFNGTGASRAGHFVEIAYFDAAMAGLPGYDDAGYADQGTQDALAGAAGAFRFSRPEDVAANPSVPAQAVLAATGHSSFPADIWGTLYLIDVEFGDEIAATLDILYDGDDAGAGQFGHPDYGLRSPDNLDWSASGPIYVQEDRAIDAFGATSGIEASVWALDPATGLLARIALMDRTALPAGQSDSDPGRIGAWESSGVLDVTGLFGDPPGLTLLLANVQAHSLEGEPLGGANHNSDLVQGGQMLLLSRLEDLTGLGDGRVSAGEPGAVLLQNLPNPFNPSTLIRFTLAEAGYAALEVFDASGHLVRTLASGRHPAGPSTVEWNGRDDAGRELASGVYPYRLETAGGAAVRRMILIK